MRLWRSTLLVIVTALAGGCQSRAETGYVETVSGNYRELAACFSRQQVEQEEDRPGAKDPAKKNNLLFRFTRRIEVDDPQARVIEIAVGGYSGLLYRPGFKVRFTGLDEGKTEVRGWPGVHAAAFWWPNEVMRPLAAC